MACTHTGLSWQHRLPDGRFALNCGVVGKPDHDGDPAAHYAIADFSQAVPHLAIRRVSYDHNAWPINWLMKAFHTFSSTLSVPATGRPDWPVHQ